MDWTLRTITLMNFKKELMRREWEFPMKTCKLLIAISLMKKVSKSRDFFRLRDRYFFILATTEPRTIYAAFDKNFFRGFITEPTFPWGPMPAEEPDLARKPPSLPAEPIFCRLQPQIQTPWTSRWSWRNNLSHLDHHPRNFRHGTLWFLTNPVK